MANARIEEEEYVGPALSKHDWQYIGVGFGLAVITAIEVVLYSVEKSGNISPAVNTWSLLVLSFIKFVIVAGFFMHLKTDNPLFKRMFVVGATLAGFAYLAMLTAFGVFRTWVPWVAYVGFAVVAVVLAMRRSGVQAHADHDHEGHDHEGHDKADSLAGAGH
jgi:heme/copper-type cytochrome/quinol oxidase subunit 4